MPWYCAHAVMLVEYDDHFQDNFPIWENVYLIEAGSREEVTALAEECARSVHGQAMTCDGRPAKLRLLGIRRVVDCFESGTTVQSGTEITHISMEVQASDDLKRFMDGEEVTVLLSDLWGRAHES